MGIETQAPTPPAGNLTSHQVRTFQGVEPKALGSIQIIIAVLCLCLSISTLQIANEIHFTPDLVIVVIIAAQLLASGSILIHTGRFPSLFWVKTTLVVHLVSAAFATAVLGLLSRHLPYRQDTYHCEHCRRLEIFTVLLLDGLLATLILFLVVELVLCIVTILFGLKVLTTRGQQLPFVGQRAEPPAVPAQPEITPAQQVTVVVTEEPESELEPAIAVIEEAQTPPTEPQVEPIDSIAEV
ncbi:membrane-spanning 4-domains subfamily A member 4A isoform X2 [Hoplias malabaricus]|uniref:membrane-spanning 4-domains subfamily A member 4A isoform X2 n=1 Tax=Hoplias malabaricus TaxID=27720 RepID=UPI00346354EA